MRERLSQLQAPGPGQNKKLYTEKKCVIVHYLTLQWTKFTKKQWCKKRIALQLFILAWFCYLAFNKHFVVHGS